ncbi:hypothetical protein [Rhodococcoides fascians]|uniref:hypothetical protein n=1 Tax=Rhodococcoides fascians TaxID=1828 RepID=UPI00114075A6|nr:MULTISPECIES: hypothetical protein [Rhodococcus]
MVEREAAARRRGVGHPAVDSAAEDDPEAGSAEDALGRRVPGGGDSGESGGPGRHDAWAVALAVDPRAVREDGPARRA